MKMTIEELIASDDFYNLMHFFYDRRYALCDKLMSYEEYRALTISHMAYYSPKGVPDHIKVSTFISNNIAWAMARNRRQESGTKSKYPHTKHSLTFNHDRAKKFVGFEEIEDTEFVQKMLATANLSESEKQFYQLRYVEGLKLREIASIMGVTKTRVDQHHTMMLHKLRLTKIYRETVNETDHNRNRVSVPN